MGKECKFCIEEDGGVGGATFLRRIFASSGKHKLTFLDFSSGILLPYKAD
jgi:hypothetical protein